MARRLRLRYIFGIAALALTSPFWTLQGGMQISRALPGLSSQPIEEYLEANDVDPSFLQSLEDDDEIRVMDPETFWSALYMGGHDNAALLGDIYADESLSLTDKVIAAAFTLSLGTIVDVANAESYLYYAGQSSYMAAIIPGRDGRPHMMIPPHMQSSDEFLSGTIGVPEDDIGAFDNSEFLYHYVLFHEIGHTDHITEYEADEFAIEALKPLFPDVDVDKAVKSWRALTPIAGLVADPEHATALQIDQRERGLPVYDLETAGGAYMRMYDYINENIDGIYVHTATYDFYVMFSQALANGEFNHDPDMKRIAELYVEGLQYFVPDADVKSGLVADNGEFETAQRRQFPGSELRP